MVTLGEPPLAKSRLSNGRRWFADGRVDRFGVPRRTETLGSVATSDEDSDRDGDGDDIASNTLPSDLRPGKGKAKADQGNPKRKGKAVVTFEFSPQEVGSESEDESAVARARRRPEGDPFRPVSIPISTSPIHQPLQAARSFSKPVYMEVSDEDEEGPVLPNAPSHPASRPSGHLPTATAPKVLPRPIVKRKVEDSEVASEPLSKERQQEKGKEKEHTAERRPSKRPRVGEPGPGLPLLQGAAAGSSVNNPSENCMSVHVLPTNSGDIRGTEKHYTIDAKNAMVNIHANDHLNASVSNHSNTSANDHLNDSANNRSNASVNISANNCLNASVNVPGNASTNDSLGDS